MFESILDSPTQKEKFRVAANKLLNQCFLLRRKEDTKKEYTYIRENKEDFRNLFDLLGYELKINEDQGVIALVSHYDSGRLQLNKTDSILLLILRLLYIEKRKEISSSYEDVTVIMEEIREKYNMLKIRSKPVMDKGMERRMVSLFRKYNIILNLDSDVNLADTRIIIYPSVMMAVTVDNINDYYEMTEKKLREYSGEASDTEDEDA